MNLHELTTTPDFPDSVFETILYIRQNADMGKQGTITVYQTEKGRKWRVRHTHPAAWWGGTKDTYIWDYWLHETAILIRNKPDWYKNQELLEQQP